MCVQGCEAQTKGNRDLGPNTDMYAEQIQLVVFIITNNKLKQNKASSPKNKQINRSPVCTENLEVMQTP